MTVKFYTEHMEISPRDMPNGVVLVLSIRYAGQVPGGDLRGRTAPKIYEYAFLKAAGVWHGSGSGKVPQAAGWGAIERWLERDGREVVRVEIMSHRMSIWPVPASIAVDEHPSLDGPAIEATPEPEPVKDPRRRPEMDEDAEELLDSVPHSRSLEEVEPFDLVQRQDFDIRDDYGPRYSD